MLNNLVYRKATNADSSQIIKLVSSIWVDEYKFNVSLENYPDLQKIEEYYHNKGGNFIICLTGDEIIGTVACDKLSENEFAFKRMFVRKKFRGNGIGKNLLNQIIDFLPSQSNLYLCTKKDLAITATELYLRNNFKIISKDEMPKNFPFFYEDDLFMRRVLP